MEYTVRRLENRDLFRVLRLTKHATTNVRESVKDAVRVVSTGAEGVPPEVMIDQNRFIFAVLDAVVEQEDAIKELFADLVGMTSEEFDSAPYDSIVDILGVVMEQDDFPGFLSKVFSLASKMSGETSTSSKPATAGRTKK